MLLGAVNDAARAGIQVQLSFLEQRLRQSPGNHCYNGRRGSPAGSAVVFPGLPSCPASAHWSPVRLKRGTTVQWQNCLGWCSQASGCMG